MLDWYCLRRRSRRGTWVLQPGRRDMLLWIGRTGHLGPLAAAPRYPDRRDSGALTSDLTSLTHMRLCQVIPCGESNVCLSVTLSHLSRPGSGMPSLWQRYAQPAPQSATARSHPSHRPLHVALLSGTQPRPYPPAPQSHPITSHLAPSKSVRGEPPLSSTSTASKRFRPPRERSSWRCADDVGLARHRPYYLAGNVVQELSVPRDAAAHAPDLFLDTRHSRHA